ncbi:pyruvate formate-lyase, partial [Streptococcus parasanguinis]|uniref:pyruvate formate lyase family protein n=1 Tax=Streptococcus parasanguinis TaxID=1318 RepID=UPI0022223371
EDAVNARLSEDIRLAEKQGVLHRGGISMSGDGHIVPDHEMILKRGFRSLIEEAQEALQGSGLDENQRNYYEAVIISLEGALTF